MAERVRVREIDDAEGRGQEVGEQQVPIFRRSETSPG